MRIVWRPIGETGGRGNDLALQGEMTITITLANTDGGTEVVGIHDGIPRGVSIARQRGRRADGAGEARCTGREKPKPVLKK